MKYIFGERRRQRKIHKLQIMCKCSQKKRSPGPVQEAAKCSGEEQGVQMGPFAIKR